MKQKDTHRVARSLINLTAVTLQIIMKSNTLNAWFLTKTLEAAETHILTCQKSRSYWCLGIIESGARGRHYRQNGRANHCWSASLQPHLGLWDTRGGGGSCGGSNMGQAHMLSFLTSMNQQDKLSNPPATAGILFVKDKHLWQIA